MRSLLIGEAASQAEVAAIGQRSSTARRSAG
jgi:hypothetical protein